MRVELSTDGNVAAQALLNSKVEQLRMQMENMQVLNLTRLICHCYTYRAPTCTGNPGKIRVHFSVREKSGNF